jgi:hypothetical protein
MYGWVSQLVYYLEGFRIKFCMHTKFFLVLLLSHSLALIMQCVNENYETNH